MLKIRENELSKESQKQLLLSDSIRTKREHELLNLLQKEKENTIIEQAKYKTIIRKLENEIINEKNDIKNIKENQRIKNIQILIDKNKW